jgi:hypothetical protein
MLQLNLRELILGIIAFPSGKAVSRDGHFRLLDGISTLFFVFRRPSPNVGLAMEPLGRLWPCAKRGL